MLKKISFLRKVFEKVFTAFTYEHSGEMLSLSRKKQVLSGGNENYSVNHSRPVNLDRKIFPKRILMSVDKVIDPELLKFTIDAANRFNADIDVLSSQSYDEVYKIMEHEISSSSITWRLIKLETELLPGMSEYFSAHPDVLFMVTNQHKELSGDSVKSRYAA